VKWYGYIGKILRIDLSREKFRVEDLKPEDVDLFVGGSGLAAKIICTEVNPQ